MPGPRQRWIRWKRRGSGVVGVKQRRASGSPRLCCFSQWDCVAPDGSLGANACFASGWSKLAAFFWCGLGLPAPCTAGGWVDAFHSILFDFTTATGMSMVELDGPYGGG